MIKLYRNPQKNQVLN